MFHDLKDKAQSALNATPLGQYIPSRSSDGQSSNSGSGSRSYAFDVLQHQIRTLQLQYGSSASKDVRQLQLIITGHKGHILDLDREAQDVQAISKELYIWGQTENSDIKDVSDRLAYLTFVQGGLAASLAASIDASRAPLKALRDAEAQLQPRRNIRTNYELQISRLKNENKPGTGGKIRELETMLSRAEAQDEPLEKEIELLKRKAIVDSETQRWDAIREYGEKLALLAQASKPILHALPSVPPSPARPYTGAAVTARTRATLQKALDTYKPGTTTLDLDGGVDPEIRSFGETHASELTRIGSVADRQKDHGRNVPSPPPPSAAAAAPPSAFSYSQVSQGSPALSTAAAGRTSSDAGVPSPSTPVDPLSLNNNPTPLPAVVTNPEALVSTTSSEPQSAISVGTIPTNAPTVAETGVPLTGGKDGPGPASGSLMGGKHRPSEASSIGNLSSIPELSLSKESSPQFPSAEEEKKRLEREERERVLANEAATTGVGPSRAPTVSRPHYETAEEEKKRLEREERERVLRGDDSSKPPPGEGGDDDGNAPPPYEDPK
ncbi:hypothetical protein Clacol_003054 [Clathrus columnatus]|uniref:Eisosome component PIL1-domain-containing protein n=1 Tax=Clathrus columnatus TaxID=1419009 RepID=A0AAV5A3J6_9AGAM|nr:hypothetical protein Clacol_003054 [Clathrus columnatus]